MNQETTVTLPVCPVNLSSPNRRSRRPHSRAASTSATLPWVTGSLNLSNGTNIHDVDIVTKGEDGIRNAAQPQQKGDQQRSVRVTPIKFKLGEPEESPIQTIQTFQGYFNRSNIQCVCGFYSGRLSNPVTPGSPGTRGRSRQVAAWESPCVFITWIKPQWSLSHSRNTFSGA